MNSLAPSSRPFSFQRFWTCRDAVSTSAAHPAAALGGGLARAAKHAAGTDWSAARRARRRRRPLWHEAAASGGAEPKVSGGDAERRRRRWLARRRSRARAGPVARPDRQRRACAAADCGAALVLHDRGPGHFRDALCLCPPLPFPPIACCGASSRRQPSTVRAQAVGCSLGEGSKDWSGACAAVFEGGAPRVVENENGGRVTPSVVAFADDGEALVGLTAKKLLFSSRATAVYGHQLLLGRAFESRETEALLAATKVSESISRTS